jgi:hypothetical protein
MTLASLAHPLVAALALLGTPVLASDPIRLADWRTFLHGEPPPVVKAPPPTEMAVVSTDASSTVDAEVESFMRALAAAVMARDAAPVLPRLSERYSVDGAPEGSKPAEFMSQAIWKMRGPSRIVIVSVQKQAEIRTARAEFRYGADKVSLKTFRFDRNGNLLESDLFSLSRGQR